MIIRPAVKTFEEVQDALRSVQQQYSVEKSYFSTEQLTGGRWIDGRPIYRKVVVPTSTFFSTNNQQYAHGILNLGTYRQTSGMFQNSDGLWFNLNCPTMRSGVLSFVSVIFQNDDNITSYETPIAGLGTFVSGFVVLEYTKSTDLTS